MTQKPHVTIHRKDYTAPAYWVNTVEMGFDLDPAATRVSTRITLQRNSASPSEQTEPESKFFRGWIGQKKIDSGTL